MKDEIPVTKAGDPNMAAAIEKAKSTLDGFLAMTRNPSATYKSVSVKVALTDLGNTEHFWITPFFEKDGQFFGSISTPPRTISNVSMGKTVQFRRDEIVDWMYIEAASQRMHGNFTACALLKKESPGEAEKLKRQFGLTCDR